MVEGMSGWRDGQTIVFIRWVVVDRWMGGV